MNRHIDARLMGEERGMLRKKLSELEITAGLNDLTKDGEDDESNIPDDPVETRRRAKLLDVLDRYSKKSDTIKGRHK